MAKVFCIEVCGYAVMSNHTHIVLYVDDKKAERLSDKAIVIRWHKLFKGNWLTQKYINGDELSESERSMLAADITEFRLRLASISWFMRVLNESIARRANEEDGCTGRFWEGRFKSQALLDTAALAACMAYVDLNPIRAKVADTPESSDYASIKKRIERARQGKQPKSLRRFAGNPRTNMPSGLPFDLTYYIQLVELTGRCMRAGKRGCISDTEPLLARLQIEPDNWLKLTTRFTKIFHGAVGRKQAITDYCEHLHKKRRANLAQSERLLC
ncbi:transposase [Pseudoalteromonas rubra]|uniref:transposase n=1 Tax=Pseudoalteromonas rubra TaxID=43658 RepID=UPI001F0B42F7|nr:transposase [Pseudoalteromonas rubra]